MGRTLAFLCLIALGTFTGCSSKDDPVQANGFTLTIINDSAEIFDVWIESPASSSGYENKGRLDASSERQFELDADGTYVVRLVPPGKSASEFVHERTVSSSGSDVTWVIGA